MAKTRKCGVFDCSNLIEKKEDYAWLHKCESCYKQGKEMSRCDTCFKKKEPAKKPNLNWIFWEISGGITALLTVIIFVPKIRNKWKKNY